MPLITGMTEGTVFANGDWITYVDISDASQAATGTTKKATLTNFYGAVDHDALTNYVAAEHVLVGALDHDSLLNYVAAEHVLVGALDHDSLLNYDAAEHVLVAALDHDLLLNFTSTEHFTMLDEDAMGSNSATQAATQQSIKALVTSGTVTFTNKRVTIRETSEASSATPTINTDNSDIHRVTALATAITSMTTNLSGTETHGQKLIIEILDNGTARAITWGADFRSTDVGTLPATTTLSKLLRVGLMYDIVDAKWECVAVSNEV